METRYIDETGITPEQTREIPAGELKAGDKVRVHWNVNTHGSVKEVLYEEVGSVTLSTSGKHWQVWKPDGESLTHFNLNDTVTILK